MSSLAPPPYLPKMREWEEDIDKQKALGRDCIYNIENMDLEIGVSGVHLNLL